MLSFKPTLYKKVSSQDDVSLDEGYQEKEPQKSSWPRKSTLTLSITTLVFGFYSLYLTLLGGTECSIQGFKEGYETEWRPAKEAIHIQKVTYTSALRYNETSKGYYREYDPTQPQYVGKPSPEIDKAWNELLAGQYLALSKDEASEIDNPVDIQGYYLAEVEVMHSLHCLNAIRKAISPEYYAEHRDDHSLPADVELIHVDHCLEQLRQNVQCAGDLTPVPLRPYGEGDKAVLIGTPQVHTCRNWDHFRSWYTDRGDSYGKVNTVST